MTARPQLPERTPRAKGEPTALDGLLVVDFTRVVAGPACTQTLADFGAEVVKIENPDGGDDTRHYEHAEIGGESAAFLSLNRNKRGIALDFTNPVALEVARELIAKADVVVENFSASVMQKFGLDYPSVGPEHAWLAAGSQMVQQQALRDFAQAMTAFYDPHNPARLPTWRKAGRDEGFRIVGKRGRQWDIRRLSRHVGEVRVPKAGWFAAFISRRRATSLASSTLGCSLIEKREPFL